MSLDESLSTTSGDDDISSDPILADLLEQQATSWMDAEEITADKLVEMYESRAGQPASHWVVMEIVSSEIYIRQSLGLSPTLTEYQKLFPQLGDAIEIQWQVDQLLEESTRPSESLYTDGAQENVYGRYLIVNTLGTGSMGIVYEAWDPNLKRVVALKRLRDGGNLTYQDQQRMRLEAEVIAKISHPNIVQIFDVGGTHEAPFLAMELCTGGTLADRLNGNPMGPKLAAEVLVKIASGVSAAHAHKIIHRDLKPANVLLENADSWNPKVADFGLAKRLDGEFSGTATEHILGTPAYMSPEQAFGSSRGVTIAADIYSLGAILYECLTGRPPFRGNTIADTLDQVRNVEPVAVRKFEPTVPYDLETITHKCLDKVPENRYPSVDTLIEDLNRFLLGAPIRARREPLHRAAYRLVVRYPMVSSLIGVSVALLLTIAVGSTLFAESLRVAYAKALASEREAKLGQADALIGRAHGTRLSHAPGQRFETLAAIRKAIQIGKELKLPKDWFENVRDEAVAALVLPDVAVEKIRTNPVPILCSDFSDDHALIAVMRETGNVSIRKMESDQEVMVLPRPKDPTGVEFVGNDKVLFFSYPRGEIECWKVDSAPPRKLWEHSAGGNFDACAVHPSRRFVAVSNRSGLKIIDVATGTISSLPIPNGNAWVRDFHPYLEHLLLCHWNRIEADIVNYRTGEVVQHLQFPELSGDVHRLISGAWSPDGMQLVIGCESSSQIWLQWDEIKQIYVLSRVIPTTETVGGGLDIKFSSNGNYLLAQGWSNRVSLLDSQTGNAIASSLRVKDTLYNVNLKIDPQSTHFGIVNLLESPNQSGWLRIAGGEENINLIPSNHAYNRAAFDASSRMVVTAIGDELIFASVGNRKVIHRWRIDGLSTGGFDSIDQRGNFYVHTELGSLTWPYWFSGTDNSRLHLGIPKRTQLPPGNGAVHSSADGGVLLGTFWNGYAGAQFAGVWLKAGDEPAARRITPFQSASLGCVSPDGNLAGFELGEKSILYDVQTMKQVMETRSGWSGFDGHSKRMLLGHRIRQLENDTSTSCIGEPLEISHDGHSVLSLIGDGQANLSNLDDQTVYFRLEGSRPHLEALSPCGRYLLNADASGFRIADLKLIRKELLELGLPWDGPQYVNAHPLPIKGFELDQQLQDVDSCEKLYAIVDANALEVAQADPNAADKAFAASMVYVQRRQWDKAMEWIDRSCNSMPESITPRMWRAYILAVRGDLQAAVRDADWVFDRYQSPEFVALRMEWLIKLRDNTRALKDCQWLIDNSNRWQPCAVLMRSLCRQVDELAKDSAEVQAARKLLGADDSTLLWRMVHMVEADISLRQPLLASLLLDIARERGCVVDPKWHYHAALVEFRNGRFEEALAELRELIADEKGEYYSSSLALAGACEASLGNVTKANEHLDKVAGASKHNVSPSEALEARLLATEALQMLEP